MTTNHLYASVIKKKGRYLMANNITPIEALEKMKILFFNIKGCTHSASGQPNKRAYELAKEGQDIATQALAPQEPQEKD